MLPKGSITLLQAFDFLLFIRHAASEHIYGILLLLQVFLEILHVSAQLFCLTLLAILLLKLDD